MTLARQRAGCWMSRGTNARPTDQHQFPLSPRRDSFNRARPGNAKRSRTDHRSPLLRPPSFPLLYPLSPSQLRFPSSRPSPSPMVSPQLCPQSSPQLRSPISLRSAPHRYQQNQKLRIRILYPISRKSNNSYSGAAEIAIIDPCPPGAAGCAVQRRAASRL